MKTTSFKTLILLAIAFIGALFAGSPASSAADKEYSFSVHNATQHTIKAVIVSEDKEKLGKFNIGEGIPAGETVKLVWNKETNDQDCNQWVKAVFDDGSESDFTKFDFCADDLVITFSAK